MLAVMAVQEVSRNLPANASEMTSPDPETEVHIVYTGGTRGASFARVDFSELAPAFRDIENPDIKPGDITSDNVFRSGSWFIYTDQGPLTLEDFSDFFQQGPLQTTGPEPISILSTDYAHVIEMKTPTNQSNWALDWLGESLAKLGGYEDARRLNGWHYRLSNGAGTQLYMIDLRSSEGPEFPRGTPHPDLKRPDQWEMIPSAALKVQSLTAPAETRQLLVVGRPLGDGLRRLALQKQLREQHPKQTLNLDLGNALEMGVSESVRERRAFSLKQIADLHLDALIPGEAELSLPRADFERLAESTPILAMNLVPLNRWRNRPAGLLLKRINGIQVAVIGIVDDRHFAISGLGGSQDLWHIEDPTETTRKAIRDLAALPDEQKPAYVVLATNVSDERLQTLRHLNGITVVLADLFGTPGEILAETASVSGTSRARSRASLMLARSSPARVGRLSARYTILPEASPRLNRLENEARLVTDELFCDPSARDTLNRIKARHQKIGRELLLPDIRELHLSRPGPQADSPPRDVHFIDGALWQQFLTHVLWKTTHSEAVFLRPISPATRAIGAIKRSTIEGWLEVGDRLVDLTVSGKTLKQLAALEQPQLSWAGFDPKTGAVLGTGVNDDEIYRVTTTDTTTHLPSVQAVLSGAMMRDRWQGEAATAMRPSASGKTVPLREHLVNCLLALKGNHHGTFSKAYVESLRPWFQPSVWDTPARWSLRLEDGELSSQSLQSGTDPAFSQVRNTRVTAPSSQTLGGRGRLAILFESPYWALENQLRSVYRRQTLVRDGQNVSQETDDEVSVRSEIRLKRLGIPFPGAPLIPFGSYAYTTEFVPDTFDSLTKPRRSELSAITGLMTAPGGIFREWRFGTALRNDLANPGLLEPGLYLSGGFERNLAPVSQAKIRTGLEIYQYLPTEFDTPDRLGLLGTLTSGLSIPLWERFTLNVSADWFVFSGKVPATQQFRSSLEFRAGLGYSLAWKPLHGVWF